MDRRSLIKFIPGGLLSLFVGGLAKKTVAKDITLKSANSFASGNYEDLRLELAANGFTTENKYQCQLDAHRWPRCDDYRLQKLEVEYDQKLKDMKECIIRKVDEFLKYKENEATEDIIEDAHRIARGEDFVYIRNKRQQVQTWGESIGPLQHQLAVSCWSTAADRYNWHWKCDDAIVYELSSGHKFIVREDPKCCTSTDRYFDTKAEWENWEKGIGPCYEQSQEELDYAYALVEADAFKVFRKRGRNTPEFYQKRWDEMHEYWENNSFISKCRRERW